MILIYNHVKAWSKEYGGVLSPYIDLKMYRHSINSDKESSYTIFHISNVMFNTIIE
jgi:hypothetical protein